MIKHQTLRIDGLDVFVREAGARTSPAIVLLHGFPSSSNMFRGLIPLLAPHFRVIAPDMIGFGHSSAPKISDFTYSFDRLAAVTEQTLAALEVDRSIFYMHDYGGPVGMRLATRAPQRVAGLVFQNANAYMDGVSEAVANLFLPLWKERNETTVAAARSFLTLEATRGQYLAGARDVAAIDPTAWVLDQALLDRPGVADAQLELFVDYQTNVGLYEGWHRYFRERQPKTLIPWGKNDPFFVEAGARAFLRDLPNAELALLDGGHFVLEEHAADIATRIIRTFA